MKSLEQKDRWIAYRKPNSQARFRLFCFHYAGGAASVFRGWQQALPAEIDVCPVQLPGRESRLREVRYQRLGPLLDELSGALEALFDPPFAFFGHSMGSIIAFELALRLRKEGKEGPFKLLLSGRRAPHRPEAAPPLHALPEEEFKDELRRLNGTPEAVLSHPELMELLTPVLRADFAVCETYEHEPTEPLDCPLTVLGGLEDAEVSSEDLESWRRYSRGDFQRRMFPGDHFYLNGAAKTTLIDTVARELMNGHGHLEGSVLR